MIYGYARVSTTDQNLDVQRDALLAAGCEMIREEKRSGASQEGRDELALLLEFIRPGDVLTVTKIDRLARSVRDLMEIHDKIVAKGASLRILNMGLDTSSPTGKLMLGVLGSVAEFERDLILERQREGIQAAKAKGIYKGRKPSVPRAKVLEMKAAGKGPAEIARTLQIGESSVFRVLREAGNTKAA